MPTVFSSSTRTPVRTRRYAPKGNRPVFAAMAPMAGSDGHPHAFTPRHLDPVSCVLCNLPRANGRHRPRLGRA